MKYIKYIVRNATRNKLRSILTILSLCISMAMMTVLYAFLTMQDALLPELAAGNRIIVMHRQGFASDLPISMLHYVRSVPGVKAAIPLTWYLGKYADERMPLPTLATDAQQLFQVWDVLELDPGQLADWQNDRQGCVTGRKLAEHRGWKIGDRLAFEGSNYDFNLQLTLRGIYDGPEYIQDIYFHWEYLNGGLEQKNSPKKDQTSILFVKADNGDVIARVCDAIDERYRNSDTPTLSQSHQEFAQMFSKFVGNLHEYVRNIGFAVAFSLTLVAANAMAMSMRERTTEIAVLKAIGFQRGLVLTLILGESVLISTVGGVLGVTTGRGVWAAAHAMFPLWVPLARVSWSVLAWGVVIALGIGLASGIIPAVRAAQLSVIAGLRRVV